MADGGAIPSWWAAGVAEGEVMGDGFGLDAWWDEPAYQAARGSFSATQQMLAARHAGPRPALTSVSGAAIPTSR